MQKTLGLFRQRIGMAASLAGMLIWAGGSVSNGVFAADAAPGTPAVAPAAKATALPSVVNDAPVNTAVLVLVPNPTQFSQRLAASTEAIGLSFPLLTDGLGQFKTAFGVSKGMAEDGPVMVVFPAAKSGLFGSALDGQTLAYFPITNYQDFLGNFGGDANVLTTQVKLPRDFTGYCRRLGTHAVFGSQKATLDAMVSPAAGKPIMDALGAKGIEQINHSDFSIVLNLAVCRAQILADLDAKIASTSAEREKLAKDKRPSESGPLVAKVASYQALKAVVNEASGIVISGNFHPHGVVLQASVQLGSSSTIAGLLKTPRDAAPLLSLLPTEFYMATQAVSLDSFKTDALVDMVTKQIEPMVEDPLSAILVRMLPVMNKATGYAETYNSVASPSGFGNADVSVMVFQTKDAAGLRQALSDCVVNLEKKPILGLSSVGSPFFTKYSKDHLRIGDLPVDQYEIRVQAQRNVLDAGKDSPFLQMLASTAISGYVCVGPDFVIVTTVPDAAVIRTTIDSVKKKSGTGDSRGVRFTRTNMPAGPSIEFMLTSSAFLNGINLQRAESKLPALTSLPVTSQLGVSLVTAPSNLTVTTFVGTDLARVIYLASTLKDPAFNNATAAPENANQAPGAEQPGPSRAVPAPGSDMPPMMPPGGPGMPPGGGLPPGAPPPR
jgi:hypothetical protein